MTLSDLGRQYKKDIKTLDSQIKRLKNELKEAKTEKRKKEIYYKIYVLEDMRGETASIAEHLIHYYEER